MDAMNTQWWGDNFILQIKDMISETCRLKNVPDCEFFVNKRDYPNLKFHCYNNNNGIEGEVVEPYGFLFDKNDKDPNDDIDERSKNNTIYYIVDL